MFKEYYVFIVINTESGETEYKILTNDNNMVLSSIYHTFEIDFKITNPKDSFYIMYQNIYPE